MIDLYFLSVIGFFALLAIIIYKDRKNIDVKYVLFMRRTKRFRNTLDSIANLSTKGWKIIGTFGIIFCLFFMIYGSFSLINSAYLVYTGVLEQPPLQLALPIPSQDMAVGPGYIGIPFWFWIIAISLILIPHETFHGIMSRAEKIKLKDVGLLLLAIFPGAFVEPDEKQLEKSKTMTKLRIFAAGSFINITLGILIILLVQQFLWAPSVNGIVITKVYDGSQAQAIGLMPGMVIDSVNGRNMNIHFLDYSFGVLMIPKSNTEDITYDISYSLLSNALANSKNGDIAKITADGTQYDMPLLEDPENSGHILLGFESRASASNYDLFYVIFPLLGLCSVLSVLVGIFNIMPIYPLDGGLVVKAITDRFFKKKISDNIVMGITVIMLVVIAYSVVGGFI